SFVFLPNVVGGRSGLAEFPDRADAERDKDRHAKQRPQHSIRRAVLRCTRKRSDGRGEIDRWLEWRLVLRLRPLRCGMVWHGLSWLDLRGRSLIAHLRTCSVINRRRISEKCRSRLKLRFTSFAGWSGSEVKE